MERRIKQKEIKNAKRKDVVTADPHSEAADKHGKPQCNARGTVVPVSAGGRPKSS
jgi:hypothetical protein